MQNLHVDSGVGLNKVTDIVKIRESLIRDIWQAPLTFLNGNLYLPVETRHGVCKPQLRTVLSDIGPRKVVSNQDFKSSLGIPLYYKKRSKGNDSAACTEPHGGWKSVSLFDGMLLAIWKREHSFIVMTLCRGSPSVSGNYWYRFRDWRSRSESENKLRLSCRQVYELITVFFVGLRELPTDLIYGRILTRRATAFLSVFLSTVFLSFLLLSILSSPSPLSPYTSTTSVVFEASTWTCALPLFVRLSIP